MDAITISRKYEGLPDLDSAPDIYETPELTEDTSTVPGTAQSDDELDTGDNDTGISRNRLRIDEARSRFLPAHIDASTADFSDRVDGKRRSYKSSSRRERILPDGTRELGDLSDEEEDEESLERKLARLRREAEEVKAEFAKRKTEASSTQAEGDKAEGEGAAEGKVDPLQSLATLSSVLDEMASLDPIASSLGTSSLPAGPAADKRPKGAQDASATAIAEATYTVTYAPAYEQSHALAKAADFDRRLLLLEKALGIGSTALPEADVNGTPRAIIPTIENLQRQISTLSQASTASLDTTSRRVRSLTQEITQLNDAKARSAALTDTSKMSAPAISASPIIGIPSAAGTGKPAGGDDLTDQTAKINALYGTLPTIETLAPLLPPLLDRLRSLRTLHADAAGAADALLEVEARQLEMATEIKMWREGLEKVEAKIGESEKTMGGNVAVVEGWVKDLEARLGKL